LRVRGETRRADLHNERRRQHAKQGDDKQRQRQQSGNVVDEQTGVGITTPVLVFGKDGHEGLGECPLREQAPQQIGDLEGNEKRIGGHASAESPRDDRVPHEAEDAGNQRHAAHRGERFQQIHGVKTLFGGTR
jgi:hypothetical protein